MRQLEIVYEGLTHWIVDPCSPSKAILGVGLYQWNGPMVKSLQYHIQDGGRGIADIHLWQVRLLILLLALHGMRSHMIAECSFSCVWALAVSQFGALIDKAIDYCVR
jgi:hypothetical protein